jgi:hypothetical protein
VREAVAQRYVQCGAISGAEPTRLDAIAREVIGSLLDPAKVATLKGDRPANSRAYKVQHYWLETGHRAGGDVAAIMETAQAATGYKDSSGGRADRASLLWSRRKLEAFGYFTEEGMASVGRCEGVEFSFLLLCRNGRPPHRTLEILFASVSLFLFPSKLLLNALVVLLHTPFIISFVPFVLFALTEFLFTSAGVFLSLTVGFIEITSGKCWA